MLFQLRREHRVDHTVFVVAREVLRFELLTQIIHVFVHCARGFDGAAGDGFLACLFGSLLLHHGIDWRRAAAVVAERDVGGLRRDLFPAAEFDIQECLHADDLRGRCHQRDPAEGFAHHGDFAENFLELVFHLLFFELRAEIREHPAGYLVFECIDVDHLVFVAGEVA